MWLMPNQYGHWSVPNRAPLPEGQPEFDSGPDSDRTRVLPAQQPGSFPQPQPVQSQQQPHVQQAETHPAWGSAASWQTSAAPGWGYPEGQAGTSGVQNSPGGTPGWGYPQQTAPGQIPMVGQEPVAGQPSAWGTPPARREPRDDNPFKALLDFEFKQYATPGLVKIVYILAVLVGVGGWVLSVLGAFSFSSFVGGFGGGGSASGVATLLFGWLPAALFIALVRFTLEFYLVNIRTNAKVAEILEQMRTEREGEAS